MPLGSGAMALVSGCCGNSENAEAFGHLMIITADVIDTAIHVLCSRYSAGVVTTSFSTDSLADWNFNFFITATSTKKLLVKRILALCYA